jgi:hypothetical protein
MRIFPNVCLAVFAVALCMVSIGCGVSQKKTDDVKARIKMLEQKGVPDSLLSDAKVLLIQIQSSKQYGGGASPQKLLDSAVKTLAFAEASFNATTKQLQPYVDSLRKTFAARTAGLTGPQLRVADSLIALADSNIKASQWPEAKEKCALIDGVIPTLLADEKKGAETKVKLIGTWTMTHVTKDKETHANSVEKTTYTFSKDGKVDCVEEKKGQTNENFKEDWKFQSTGTFALRADTALINLTREKCLKQTYWNLKGNEWIKSDKPTYDSLLASGKKDRFVAFNDLKTNFKKH